MTRIGFNEAAFADFFAGAFEYGFFGQKELRLCPQEAEYVRRHHPDAELRAASPAGGDEKTWFEVRFGGCPEK